jgi:hypothetical protein
MTQEQQLRLDELQTQVFEFINSIEDDVDRTECAIDIVCQAIIGGEHYFDDHKFILNEAGKQYRKTRKEIMMEDGSWNEIEINKLNNDIIKN